MSHLPDWHRLLSVLYQERVLDALFILLLSSYVLWGIYVWRGTLRLGLLGFPLWFPMLLVSGVGTVLLVRRITAPIALAVPPTMYLHLVSFFIAVLTPPLFKRQPGYIAIQAAMALGVLAVFVFILGSVVQPLLLQY